MLKTLHMLCIVLCLVFSSFVFSQQNDPIMHGPFKTNLYNDGELYFEQTSNFEYPINFVLKYQCDREIKKYIIDRYSHNGGVPEIESLFFYKINEVPYVFTIVLWNINHRGIGTYGQYYQVYGYKKNNGNILIKDETIEYDNNLSGIEGSDNGEESHFKYKTAAEVKKYIKETYNKK
ncbi:hypothetical protein RHO12_02935 [Orbus sturtevantii]|uniref:hypothetical protein n=1 Tax=Orbus sturtevantii TaxID=3074109 RepID=UPI00370D11C2